MARLRRTAAVAALVAVLAGSACTPDDPPQAGGQFVPGAEGAGDPYFPRYGNGGYDVAGYDLDLRYDPRTDRLSGTATITATATANLSRFNLDLAHLTTSAVTVDGAAAQHGAAGNELVITPATGIASGRRFTVRVSYAGVPKPLGSADLGTGGFLHSADGAIALGQPESASTWFPVNDHPSDKATFAVKITVPEGVEAIGNGSPGERSTADGWTTWRWSESTPMASYLATLVIGQYRMTSETHRGKPVVNAVATSLPAEGAGARSIARTTEIADYLETLFGPYPVEAYGGVVVDDDRIRYALETQSRPVYGNAFFRAGQNPVVVAHEVAHQWFGDSVSMRQWKDIWLNEGFASYAEWLWQEHDGGPKVQASFDAQYKDFDWSVPPAEPGPAGLFSRAVYKRGAMTVHALRLAVGDGDFFRILKQWTASKRNQNVSTADFVAFAEQVSGESLDDLFQQWLYGTTRPEVPGR